MSGLALRLSHGAYYVRFSLQDAVCVLCLTAQPVKTVVLAAECGDKRTGFTGCNLQLSIYAVALNWS